MNPTIRTRKAATVSRVAWLACAAAGAATAQTSYQSARSVDHPSSYVAIGTFEKEDFLALVPDVPFPLGFGNGIATPSYSPPDRAIVHLKSNSASFVPCADGLGAVHLRVPNGGQVVIEPSNGALGQPMPAFSNGKVILTCYIKLPHLPDSPQPVKSSATFGLRTSQSATPDHFELLPLFRFDLDGMIRWHDGAGWHDFASYEDSGTHVFHRRIEATLKPSPFPSLHRVTIDKLTLIAMPVVNGLVDVSGAKKMKTIENIEIVGPYQFVHGIQLDVHGAAYCDLDEEVDLYKTNEGTTTAPPDKASGQHSGSVGSHP